MRSRVRPRPVGSRVAPAGRALTVLVVAAVVALLLVRPATASERSTAEEPLSNESSSSVLIFDTLQDTTDPGFHKYSIARENHHYYFGTTVTRVDDFVNCQDSNRPVYMPIWVVLEHSPGTRIDTVEMGSRFCRYGPDRVDWYWGYQYGTYGQHFEWVGTKRATRGQTHKFRIEEVKVSSSSCKWRAYIDVTHVGTIRDLCEAGEWVDAGLESYNKFAVVQSQRHRSMTKLLRDTNNNGWYYWHLQDYERVDGPEMCGYWNSGHTWTAGENIVCS